MEHAGRRSIIAIIFFVWSSLGVILITEASSRNTKNGASKNKFKLPFLINEEPIFGIKRSSSLSPFPSDIPGGFVNNADYDYGDFIRFNNLQSEIGMGPFHTIMDPQTGEKSSEDIESIDQSLIRLMKKNAGPSLNTGGSWLPFGGNYEMYVKLSKLQRKAIQLDQNLKILQKKYPRDKLLQNSMYRQAVNMRNSLIDLIPGEKQRMKRSIKNNYDQQRPQTSLQIPKFAKEYYESIGRKWN